MEETERDNQSPDPPTSELGNLTPPPTPPRPQGPGGRKR
jgi:hypothetical protein